jgi:hypothetical protein
MSLRSDSTSNHLTITAPGAAALVTGPFTVATLFKQNAGRNSYVWFAYKSDNFTAAQLFCDTDVWVGFNSYDSNFDLSTAIWRWLVVTKSGSNVAPRVHVGTYSPTGSHSWVHGDVSGTMAAGAAMNRFTFGDEFGQGPDGEYAVLTAFTQEFSDAQVEARFVRSSSGILGLSPQFFTHFPFASGIGSSFVDLAGGGVETIRTGTWSNSADPTGFDFSLGRSGKPKVWDGSSWNQHPAKVWNGSSWVTHPMSAYDGSSFVVSK